MVQFAIPAPEEPPLVTITTESEAEAKAEANTPGNGNGCLKCHKQKITYECDPCGCPSFCTDCARKLASGGRCKTCHEFYGGLRKVRI